MRRSHNMYPKGLPLATPLHSTQVDGKTLTVVGEKLSPTAFRDLYIHALVVEAEARSTTPAQKQAEVVENARLNRLFKGARYGN